MGINEIQFDPPTAGAAFVEIHNASATGSFDLTGWRLEGVDFTFPPGSVLAPGGFLVVAADAAAFRQAYGTTVIPIGAFGGNLQNNGETLRLVLPDWPRGRTRSSTRFGTTASRHGRRRRVGLGLRSSSLTRCWTIGASPTGPPPTSTPPSPPRDVPTPRGPVSNRFPRFG